MSEQFQVLKELFRDSSQRPQTHQRIETAILKILSTNKVPMFVNLLKLLQQNRIDLISHHHTCFQDFWYKLKSWMGPRKPESFRSQCFKILMKLFLLHRCGPNDPVTHYESLFEDIFSTVSLINDPAKGEMKLKFFQQMYEKKKIFDIVGLVNSVLEVIVQHLIAVRHYNHQKSSSSSSSKKSKRDTGLGFDPNLHLQALEFLKILFKNTKMNSEEHFTSIVKTYSEYIVQHKVVELFSSLIIFVQKPELRIPHRGYIHLCTMLCQSVNFNESFCSRSTEIMKFLIRKNPYIFSILIDLLNYSPFITFYRGAVFFIGVFSWGRFAMKELKEFRIMTLKAMYKVLSVNDQPLNFEIILSLKRLILNFGGTIILEWEIIFKILKKMKKLFVMGKSMENAQATNRSFAQMNMRLKKEVKSCVKVVFDLYRNKKFLGGENKLLKLMLYYRPEFSDDTLFSQFLIEHIPCSPNQTEQWEDNLKLIMLEFFRKEENVMVKLQVLEIVKNLLIKYTALYSTEIMKIVMPYLKEEKRDYILFFLIWMADKLPLSSKKFIMVCSTLNHMLINETIYESHPTILKKVSVFLPPAKSTFFASPYKKKMRSKTGNSGSKKGGKLHFKKGKRGGGSYEHHVSSGSSSSVDEDGGRSKSSSPIPSGPPGKGGHYNPHVLSKRGKEIREGTKLKLMNGMVQIFLNNFAKSPVIKSKIMFNFLLKFMPHLPDSLLKEMLNVFLRFKSTPMAQLKIGDKVSPYLYVHHSSSSAPGMSAHQTDMRMQRSGFVPARRLSCEVDLSKLMEILWNLVLVKDNVDILFLILKILLSYLRNFYILKDFSVEKLIYIVTSFVQKKLLGTSLDTHLPGLVQPYGGQSSHYQPSVSSKRAPPKTLRLVLPLLDVLRMLIGFVANKPTISRAAKSEFVKLVLSLSTPEVQTRLTFDQRIEFQERYLNVLYFLVTELPDDLVPQFMSLQKYLGGLKPIYSVVILKLRLLHCLHHLFPQLIRHQRHFYPRRRFQKTDIPVVEGVLDMITPYVSKNKYSYFIRSLAYTSLMSWFVRCTFTSRKRILRKCFPILYLEMAKEKSRLAESFLDFLIKYTYINCEHKFEMNRTLNDQFRNQNYRAWSLGNGILTAQVGKFGYVLLRHRRPTGNTAWTMKLVNTVHVYNMMERSNEAHGRYNRFPTDHLENLSRDEEKSLRLDLSYLLHKRKQDIPAGVGGISSFGGSSYISSNASSLMNAKSGSFGTSLSIPSEEDLSFHDELYDAFSTEPQFHPHHPHHQIHHAPHHQQRHHFQHPSQQQQQFHQPQGRGRRKEGRGMKKSTSLDLVRSKKKKKKKVNNNDDEVDTFQRSRRKLKQRRRRRRRSVEDLDEEEDIDIEVLEEEEEEEEEEDEGEEVDQLDEDEDDEDDLILQEQYNRHKQRSKIVDNEEEEDDFFLPLEENIKENVFSSTSSRAGTNNNNNGNNGILLHSHEITPRKPGESTVTLMNEKPMDDSGNDIGRRLVFDGDAEEEVAEASNQKKTSNKVNDNINNNTPPTTKGETLSYLLRESPVLSNRHRHPQHHLHPRSHPHLEEIEENIQLHNKSKSLDDRLRNLRRSTVYGHPHHLHPSLENDEMMKKRKMKGRKRHPYHHHHHQHEVEDGMEDVEEDVDVDELEPSSYEVDPSLSPTSPPLSENKVVLSTAASIVGGGGKNGTKKKKNISSSSTTTNPKTSSGSSKKRKSSKKGRQLRDRASSSSLSSPAAVRSVLHPNFPYLFLRHWTFLSQEPPSGLKVCPELTMSLNAFDFTPCHEIFKVGVLFVDQGQGLIHQHHLRRKPEKQQQQQQQQQQQRQLIMNKKKKKELVNGEAEIFLNSFGTPRYLSFLRGLGEVVYLKKLDEMYAAGLEVSKSGRDGKYTIIHKDEISSMVFHVATMMPNQKPSSRMRVSPSPRKRRKKVKGNNNKDDNIEVEEDDEEDDDDEEIKDLKNKQLSAYHRKKSLIGNDLVVIIYNENEPSTTTGKEDNKEEDIICKSEVKTIEIIIHPLEKGYNMIKLKIRKEKLRGILSFFPLEQIVSDVQLPRIVRNYSRLSCLAINAFNKKQNDYESVWSERINMTKRIKERFTRKAKKRSSNQSQADINLQKEINDFFLD